MMFETANCIGERFPNFYGTTLFGNFFFWLPAKILDLFFFKKKNKHSFKNTYYLKL